MFGGGTGCGTRSERGGVAACAARVRRALLGLALFGATPAQAQDEQGKLLIFAGKVADPATEPGIAAIKALGGASATSRSRSSTRPRTSPATSSPRLARSSSSTRPATCWTRAGGRRGGVHRGRQGLPRHRQRRPVRARRGFFNGLIGARPTPDSPADDDRADRRLRRPRPPVDARPRRCSWNRTDVWYRGRRARRARSTRVARYHAPNAPAGDGTDVGGTDHPISWCRDYSGGRSFYTGMGRTAASYAEADFRAHLLGAHRVDRRPLRGNCKATIDSNYSGTKIVAPARRHRPRHQRRVARPAVAANGWVIYIGRGDCRTDAERGALLGADAVRSHPRPRRPRTSASAAAASTSSTRRQQRHE